MEKLQLQPQYDISIELLYESLYKNHFKLIYNFIPFVIAIVYGWVVDQERDFINIFLQ